MRNGLIAGITGAVIGSLIVLAGAWLALDTLATGIARQNADAFVERLNAEGRQASYEGLDVNALSRDMRVHGVSFQTADGGTLRIRTLEVSSFDWSHPDEPRFMTVRLRGLTPPMPEIGGAEQAMLAALGLATLDVDMSYRYDPATATLRVEDFRLATGGGGALTLRMTFGNIGRMATGDSQAFQATLLRSTFVGGELVYADNGMTERVVEALAGAGETGPAEVRENLRAQVRDALAETTNPLEIVLLQALDAFLAAENPSEVRVVAEPATPVPYTELVSLRANAETVRDRLGIRISTR